MRTTNLGPQALAARSTTPRHRASPAGPLAARRHDGRRHRQMPAVRLLTPRDLGSFTSAPLAVLLALIGKRACLSRAHRCRLPPLSIPRSGMSPVTCGRWIRRVIAARTSVANHGRLRPAGFAIIRRRGALRCRLGQRMPARAVRQWELSSDVPIDLLGSHAGRSGPRQREGVAKDSGAFNGVVRGSGLIEHRRELPLVQAAPIGEMRRFAEPRSEEQNPDQPRPPRRSTASLASRRSAPVASR